MMKKQMRLDIADLADEAASPLPFGKDEMNFAEYPIALLTDRVPKGQRTIRFEVEDYDEKRKRMVRRSRVIEGSQEYGLPTATDDAVILGLIQLTKQKSNFSSRELEFTRLELIELLGWPNEGKSYDRLKLSLLRIKMVNYVYDNAWWDSRTKSWTTKAFSIIDNVEINDSRTGQGGLFPSRILWNEVVFDSFQAGFLRNIDFQLCIRLEHPTALRIYRFLGKRFYHQPEWVFDLREFAYEHVGLGRNYEGGTQIARKLKPAIDELESVGFLAPLPETERFIKKGRKWSIRFVQQPPALQEAVDIAPAVEQPATPLVEALVKRGVTAKTAQKLVEAYAAERIAAKLEVFDWMRGENDKRLSKSPGGYLVTSITDDYAPPKGFISEAERRRNEEARRAKDAEAVAQERSRREVERRKREKEEAVAAYRAALTPEALAQLKADMLAQSDAEQLKTYNSTPAKFREGLLFARMNEHIQRLLESQADETA